jgi:acetyl esterase
MFPVAAHRSFLLKMPHLKVQLESEVQKFTEMAQPLFLHAFDPRKRRIVLNELQANTEYKSSIKTEDLRVKDGPSAQVPIRILRPDNFPKVFPGIVYVHGGGWVLGNKRTHDRLAQELVKGTDAAVVIPEYSLSPEAKYPTALEEVYSVVKWAAEHGVEHGIDPKHLAIVGDNVGGNLAAASTLISRERGGPAIQRQLLFYPVMNAAFDTESYHQYADGYYLRRDEMKWYWDQYTANPGERNEITASPLRASIGQLKGLPEALVITAEADVLRDEGEAYAEKLREAGVRVAAARFQGTIHDFVMLNALANTAAARGAMALSNSWLKDGFSSEETT